MKIKRFITEYANYRIDKIMKDGTADKDEAIRRIDRAVRLCENGLLTVDETMRIINEA